MVKTEKNYQFPAVLNAESIAQSWKKTHITHMVLHTVGCETHICPMLLFSERFGLS